MLIKSALATQMSGSIGGLTAGHNKGGMYLRGRGMMTNQNTGRQIAVRNAVTSLVQRWGVTLTDAQRGVWDTYAANVLLTNALGDPLQVSGQNMYVRSNVPRIQASIPILDDGPGLFNLGDTGEIGPVVIQDDAGFDAAVTGAPDWAGDDEGSLLLYMGLPQNAGRNFFRGPWRFVQYFAGNSTTPVEVITIPDVATMPYPVEAGQKVWFYVRASNQDGRLSSRTQIGPVLVGHAGP